MAVADRTTSASILQSLPPDPYADDPWSLAFVFFRALLDWPGYGVDTDGNLWGCLKPGSNGGMYCEWKKLVYRDTSSNGRIIVGLCRNGKRTSKQLHRIVMETFIGPCPPGLIVCHNNGDHTDNRLANLRYDTYKGNEADKKRHGTKVLGDRHPLAKLNEDKVKEIKVLLTEGKVRIRAIAGFYGVDEAVVARIRDGKAWAWVGRS